MNRRWDIFKRMELEGQIMALKFVERSGLEQLDDMRIGALRSYVQALGGELKLVASFPGADIQLAAPPSGA